MILPFTCSSDIQLSFNPLVCTVHSTAGLDLSSPRWWVIVQL